jgi:hypothetical protein
LITLASSANPATYGAPLTFTANASSTAGSLTGTVIFEDAGVSIGQGTLSGGVAIFTTSTLAPGVHPIVAAYQGDSNDAPGASTALLQTVERATTTTLSSSQNPLLTLAPVVITATVTNGGTPSASGTVIFTEGTTVLGTVTLDANATAMLTLSSLSAGQHAILATYNGDGDDFASTSASLVQTVQLRATSDTLTASATSLTGGQQVTLISVVHWTGPVSPTGTVTFMSGSLTLGTSPVDATGVATLTIIPSGSSPSMVANYTGDAVYAGSSSVPTTISIGQPSQFIMSVSESTVVVQAKQNGTVDLSMTSVQGFTDVLKLGCLGLPTSATCTFSSDSVSLTANGTQTVHVVVDTGAPLTAGGQARNESAVGSSMMLAFLPGGVLLGLIGWRARRRMRSSLGGVLLLLVAMGLAVGLSGCSGLNIDGTPAGTYSFKLTASGNGTGVTESMDMTLTVQ